MELACSNFGRRVPFGLHFFSPLLGVLVVHVFHLFGHVWMLFYDVSRHLLHNFVPGVRRYRLITRAPELSASHSFHCFTSRAFHLDQNGSVGSRFHFTRSPFLIANVRFPAKAVNSTINFRLAFVWQSDVMIVGGGFR